MSELDRSGSLFPQEEQETDVLKKALSLRMPVYEKGTDPKAKLEEYEGFMVLCAYVEAELAADKWRCIDELNAANDEWSAMSTDSDFTGTKVTLAQKERERRENDPKLHSTRRFLTQRIEQLNEQVGRMERQAKVCSRVHTFLTGT